ncbi:MAG: hypothetical protein AAFY36_04045 [Bacteroidota bacterium]
MIRLSSNTTLFFKLFLPIFYTTVIGCITLYAWLGPDEQFEIVDRESLKWALVAVFILGVTTLFLLCWPLKRVESDDEHVYVSNYFKTVRYRWTSDVASLTSSRFMLLFTIGFLELQGKGSFGKNMFFLLKRSNLKKLKDAFPGLVPEGDHEAT